MLMASGIAAAVRRALIVAAKVAAIAVAIDAAACSTTERAQIAYLEADTGTGGIVGTGGMGTGGSCLAFGSPCRSCSCENGKMMCADKFCPPGAYLGYGGSGYGGTFDAGSASDVSTHVSTHARDAGKDGD